MDVLRQEFVFFDIDVKTKEELFKYIAEIGVKNKLIDSVDLLVKGFGDREELDSTAFEDGFAIPHARNSDVKNAGAFFVRLKNPIIWDNAGKTVDCAIMLVIPESNGDYLDILSGIATKLMNKKNRDILKTSTDKGVIVKTLMSQEEKKESVVSKSKNALKVVGISACATGVVHTYMARDAILEAGKKLNWTVAVETQGQKGQEFALKQSEIDDADAVILAVDIAVDLDRFAGKKIYKVGTKVLIEDPETQLRYAVSKGKVLTKEAAASGGGAFDIKTGKAWIQHVMSGISFMIPFIVFAGIIFAVVTGVGKIVYGTWLDYSGQLSGSHYLMHIDKVIGAAAPSLRGGAVLDSTSNLPDIATNVDPLGIRYNISIDGAGIAILYYLNQFANIGFGVMIPIMAAYIANSIAGRSAITPAFVLTSAATTPTMWWHWGPFNNLITIPQAMPWENSKQEIWNLFPGNGGGIFAALAFGFLAGYTVKWINTKWRINKYVQPIMPIIIIPVFVSLIYGTVIVLLLGNIFGIIMGYVNYGLQRLEDTKIGMAALGLILGLIAGIDMGGPINKIASFGATAMIAVDGGKAMGCAAASFAVAPMGAGIAVQIFRRKFKDDQALGINATILGAMGISEGAIPFAAKYTWAAIIPNIICSGIAGMCAGLFQVSGWVGAWGGPIIAIFGGVTTWDMSYIGILWYFAAIAIAVTAHIFLFRIFVSLRENKGRLYSVKEAHNEFVVTARKAHEKIATDAKDSIEALENQRYTEVKNAKLSGSDPTNIKNKYNQLIGAKKAELKAQNDHLKAILTQARSAYIAAAAVEKGQIQQNKDAIKQFATSNKVSTHDQIKSLRENLKAAQQLTTKKAIIDKKSEIKAQISELSNNKTVKVEEKMATYYASNYEQFLGKLKALR